MDDLHTTTDHIALPMQFLSIDIEKFICALLVITIHTRPFSGISDILDFYLSDVIARIAVPLFFAISGYFFFRSLRYENGKIVNCTSNRKRLFKHLKRLGLLYVGFALFYTILQLPEWYRVGWWGQADGIPATMANGPAGRRGRRPLPCGKKRARAFLCTRSFLMSQFDIVELHFQSCGVLSACSIPTIGLALLILYP